jgi:hypothetical protein
MINAGIESLGTDARRHAAISSGFIIFDGMFQIPFCQSVSSMAVSWPTRQQDGSGFRLFQRRF